MPLGLWGSNGVLLVKLVMIRTDKNASCNYFLNKVYSKAKQQQKHSRVRARGRGKLPCTRVDNPVDNLWIACG
jgi:hypothetical protein